MSELTEARVREIVREEIRKNIVGSMTELVGLEAVSSIFGAGYQDHKGSTPDLEAKDIVDIARAAYENAKPQDN